MMTKQPLPRVGIGFTRRGNKFEATVNIPADQLPEGVKRQRITAQGDSEAEAQRKLLAKLAKGTVKLRVARGKGELTVSDWLDEWVENYLQHGVQASTLKVYKGHIENYIRPGIGHLSLAKLTIDEIRTKVWEPAKALRKMKNGVATKEPLLGNFALQNLYKTLQMAIETGAEKYEMRVKKLTKRFIKFKAPKRPEQDPEIKAAAKRLTKVFYQDLDKNDPRWSQFMLVLLGLRQSERLGLQVKSVVLNGEKPMLHIYQQLDFDRDQGGWYLKDTTKNGQPREVPLWGEFLEAVQKRLEIRKQYSKLDTWKPDPKFKDLLFLDQNGKPITRRQDTPLWHSLGVEMRGHLARHITGYILAEQSVSIDTAKLILGHKSDAYAYYYRLANNTPVETELQERYRPGEI
jgi:integrase